LLGIARRALGRNRRHDVFRRPALSSKTGLVLSIVERISAVPKSILTSVRQHHRFIAVETGKAASPKESDTALLWKNPLPLAYTRFLERRLVRFILTLQGLGAFALIALGAAFSKFNVARDVIRPLVLFQIARSGMRLLPMVSFIAVALGFVVIGQTVSVLTRVGADNFLGTVMVTVVVRELGPMLTALIVLARTGTATVVELGTARAMGEVEALEVLGIDPMHYFVFPRLIGMAVGIFALTVYLIIGAVVSGYIWAFLQGVPLTPDDYFGQLAGALVSMDFVLLALKTLGFGIIIAITTCYYGLAQPLSIDQVSNVTVRAVGQSIIFCGLLDAFFMVVYLIS
jgi:phospholipid/cholesterol/gamma-HCH transport system permease protein